MSSISNVKFKKLNSLGATHIIVPLLVVVGAAIGGTYFLVASHADQLTAKVGPSCIIKGVPAKSANNASNTAAVVITNPTTKSFKPTVTLAAGLSDGKGHGSGGSASFTFPAVAAGATQKTLFGKYFSSSDSKWVSPTIQATYTATSKNPAFTCTATVKKL